MTDEQSSNVEGNSGVSSGAGAGESWFFAEGVPGNGERPDFFDARYKTLSDQAKAYNELNKRFSMLSGAPDEYDLGEAKDMAEAQPIRELLDYFKANKISQEGANKVFGALKQYQDSKIPKVEDIISSLGPQGQDTIERVARWAENNWSGEDLESIKRLANSAENIRMLDKIRSAASGQTSQPPHGASIGADEPKESFADVRLEMIESMKSGEYHTNKLIQKQFNGRLEAARLREGME